jgi:hypothetical protein
MTLHPHQNIMDAIAEERLVLIDAAYFKAGYYVNCWYPNGITRFGGSVSQQFETRHMVMRVVGIFDHIVNQLDSSVRVQIATTPGRKPLNSVRGLILYTGETNVLPMRISPSLVRIKKKDIFLDAPGGAVAVLDVIHAELRSQIKPAKPGTTK